MYTLKLCFAAIFVLVLGIAHAATWDEPWQDKVIQQADFFVLARIKKVDMEKSITIEIIKSLNGPDLKGSISITNFYLLNICNSAGQLIGFDIPYSDSCYFFIKKDEKGAYCIATPTAGYAFVSKGKVAATYRHSYNQALINVPTYEKTMSVLFNNYHHLPYDTVFINSYVNEYIHQKPAAPDAEGMETFCNQHAALECIYHLKLSIPEDALLPFLNDSTNFHNQVSAARALYASKDAKTDQDLYNVIANPERDNFVKVMCIWALKERKPEQLKPKLYALRNKVSDVPNSFGGNSMDPRTCTNIPSVKEALKELLKELK